MENASSPQAWHDLFVMLGGAAGALTGMLFVALSLHVDDIMGSPDVKRRVATNFFALVILILASAFLLMPQPPVVLGGELVAIHAAGIYLPLDVLIRFGRNLPRHALMRAGTAVVGFGMGIAGGGCLAGGAGLVLAGLYLNAFSFLILLSLVILNAWSIMAGVYRDEARSNGRD